MPTTTFEEERANALLTVSEGITIGLDERINLRSEGVQVPSRIETENDLMQCRVLRRQGHISIEMLATIEKKYVEMKKRKYEEFLQPFIDKGERIIELTSNIYKWFTTYPKSLSVIISGTRQYIKKEDSIKTIEGHIYHRNYVPSDYRRCSDIGGEYSCDYRYIRFWYDDDRTIHNYGAVETIYHNGIYIEKGYARNGLRLVQCGECGTYRQRGSVCRCNQCQLDNYHARHGHDTITESAETSILRVGIEIEKSKQCSTKAHKSMKKAWWRCERDSTVAGEYISPVMSLDDIDKTIEFIKATAAPALFGKVNNKCWWHIHVSIEGMQSVDTYKAIVWYRPLLWALYPKRLTWYSNREASCTEHNVDVWIRPRTVELRIFPWLDSERKLRFRLSLVKFMLENPRESTEKALETIVSDARMRDILTIAYGDNTRRMAQFFKRLVQFYALWAHETTKQVFAMANDMIADKEVGMTKWQLSGLSRKKENV